MISSWTIGGRSCDTIVRLARNSGHFGATSLRIWRVNVGGVAPAASAIALPSMPVIAFPCFFAAAIKLTKCHLSCRPLQRRPLFHAVPACVGANGDWATDQLLIPARVRRLVSIKPAQAVPQLSEGQVVESACGAVDGALASLLTSMAVGTWSWHGQDRDPGAPRKVGQSRGN